MAIREDQGGSMRAPMLRDDVAFQSMPAQNFAPKGPPSRGFASQPAGYPQGQGVYTSIPQDARFSGMARMDDFRSFSGSYVGASAQPDMSIRSSYSNFQPREPLPGPWIANEPKVPKAAPKAKPSPKTSFWSTEDTVMKRERAAQHLCHMKEEILEQRITFVENILFRAMDLPAHDVKYAAELAAADKEEEEKKKAEEKDKHDHDFQRHFLGPYPTIVTSPENGFFVDSLRAVKDWPHIQDEMREHERWRKSHPVLCALAGDWHYVHRELEKADLI